ncbi:hypothetical protein [Thermithiobacillus plumbiphilus]|uniref:Rubrerythrin diiron-binding domain-containing protein n=1 Tax=Thermithiobacillus plumbiphilus TaxID=1729899 RepID=A0ABU9D679_9PROT
MNRMKLEELLYQGIETELGGIKVYEKALAASVTPEFRKEMGEYLEQTREHERIYRDMFANLGLDPERMTPGREVVRAKTDALVKSIDMAIEGAGPGGAELVAAEAVIDAEAKDYQNWMLIGLVTHKADDLSDHEKQVLSDAFDRVHQQEHQHLFHTMGWARELWMQTLGLDAEIPPREERMETKSMLGAATAAASRTHSRM